MTYTQSQAPRARQSRMLTSVFARAPREPSGIAKQGTCNSHGASTSARPAGTERRPGSWRDVTRQLARYALAERFCSRFFAPGDTSAASAADAALVPEFMTAGQCLQSLDSGGEHAGAGHRHFEAVLNAPESIAGRDEGDEAEMSRKAPHSFLTAKAA